ncbi:hypothetical protein [Fuchsiella alkaliacetigena]|uniref:hypothetical protein n=1 Tax=Fuchsiella alkaliacetigena TaxID=957042 RepID=UPI00200AC7BA|nr:hypothetical protein [Fuchsiella alkaliacetigena]MCK8825365.1 hypothetical protein [Fuchsiella alkaliacetigena]
MTKLKAERLKRAVIKEELVVLTGDFKKAIILNQFLYWSQRVKDFDQFIKEEKERISKKGERLVLKPRKGWIYKSAKDLSQETMLNLTPNTIRSHTQTLIEKGWLDQRQNPDNSWDNTYQYRVNLIKIQRDLLALGYTLEGYRFNLSLVKKELEKEDFKKEQQPPQKKKAGAVKNEPRSANIAFRSAKNCAAIPETTTETINRDNNLSRGQPEKTLNTDFEELLTYLRKQVGRNKLKSEYLLNDDLKQYGSQTVKKAIDMAVLNQKLKGKSQDIYSYAYIRYFIKKAQEISSTEVSVAYAEEEKLDQLCQQIIK